MTCASPRMDLYPSAMTSREVTPCSTTLHRLRQAQLIFPSQITGVSDTDRGIVVTLHLLVRRRAELAHRCAPRRARPDGPAAVAA